MNNVYIIKCLFFVAMSQDQKQEAILEAAIRRFAHFGVAKATMAEIASDLSLSKASLYYYFPDKLSLYAAVIKKITSENEKQDEEDLAKEKDPFKALVLYLERRTDFIIRYYNILEFLRTFNPMRMPEPLESVFIYLKKRELARLTSVIEKGVSTGLFKIKDARKTAELLYEFLDGFRASLALHGANFFPDKKQFQSILRKEIEFSLIFFNGLTIKKG